MGGLKGKAGELVGDVKGKADELVGDYSPEDVINQLFKDGKMGAGMPEMSMDIPSAENLQGFAMAIVVALLPSPEVTGKLLAKATGVSKAENVKDISLEAAKHGLLDQVISAKKANRRASSTAKKCNDPACGSFHFRMSGYCAKHCPELNRDELRASVLAPRDTVSAESVDVEVEGEKGPRASVKISRLEHDLSAVSLREEMLDKAETYEVELSVDLVQEAKALLVGLSDLPDDTEVGQFLFQFRRLDLDGDGLFTASDFLALVKQIDEKFEGGEEKVAAWIVEATVGNTEQFDFRGYVSMILSRRQQEENNYGVERGVQIPEIPCQLKQTPFWDLRSCVLHSLEKPLKGWVLKRGWLHAKESLNKWKLRYMQLGKDEAGRPTLEYWKNDPSGETNCLDEDTKEVKQPKRSIPLQNILVVDFALETVSPRGSVLPLREMQDRVGMDVENETVFKMTDAKGRRFTLACGKSEAVAWTSVLSRYSAASRLMFDWRENWGTGRKAKITMRDWVNATVVIAKIGRQKAAPEMCKEMMEAARTKTLWLGLPGGRERAIKKALYECNALVEGLVLTERDQKMLRVCNLSKEKMEKLGGYALSVVRAWNSSKDGLLKIDDYCMNGSVQYGVAATILAFDTYQFAAATNNSYHEKKYNVKTWVPKMNERDCAVCAMIFKTMSMRKTMGKHHCRTCGRVVCQMCSASRIYMPVSKKFERVCTPCLVSGPADQERETILVEQEATEVDSESESDGEVDHRG
mmetsp:Transcript_26113/g.57824  ORF Transcript_26113/g.57824 Transcript_26113/m.57824 type:complete len:751 (+) Transcript_26113:100-2352(+)